MPWLVLNAPLGKTKQKETEENASLLFTSGTQGQLCIARKVITKQTLPQKRRKGRGPEWTLQGPTKRST